MSYAKSAFVAAGVSLLVMATFGPAQAGGMLKATSSSTEIEQRVASIGAHHEIPLGLLIKTPETPHGASLNRQIASLAFNSNNAKS